MRRRGIAASLRRCNVRRATERVVARHAPSLPSRSRSRSPSLVQSQSQSQSQPSPNPNAAYLAPSPGGRVPTAGTSATGSPWSVILVALAPLAAGRPLLNWRTWTKAARGLGGGACEGLDCKQSLVPCNTPATAPVSNLELLGSDCVQQRQQTTQDLGNREIRQTLFCSGPNCLSLRCATLRPTLDALAAPLLPSSSSPPPPLPRLHLTRHHPSPSTPSSAVTYFPGITSSCNG
jgi:hypothetical protein